MNQNEKNTKWRYGNGQKKIQNALDKCGNLEKTVSDLVGKINSTFEGIKKEQYNFIQYVDWLSCEKKTNYEKNQDVKKQLEMVNGYFKEYEKFLTKVEEIKKDYENSCVKTQYAKEVLTK